MKTITLCALTRILMRRFLRIRAGFRGPRPIILASAALLVLGWQGLASPQGATSQEKPECGVAVSQRGAGRARIVKINGVSTLEVDGAPFFVVGAQCDIWRSTRQDEKTVAFFDGYQAMNATAVSVGIPWSKIEAARDHYDFQFMDWFIEQARKRGLKLILNLFNSNVCGKVQEGSRPYPQYTPGYILSAPEEFQRMVLPGPWKYDAGGPPMCPNDPRTLERERRLCVQVAEHLAKVDLDRTVIMLQLDNEFYYQQWAGARPQDETAIRCQCRFCQEKWDAGTWKNGEDFMFRSFADYARVLTDAISAAHPLPLYVNSPWWPPHVIPLFLDRCPNLALVGIDGVFAPNEPNMLSRSQLGRNIPFAAENPTENPKTRLNLDVLPYYSLIGQQGIGNLLWECGPPHTVVEDAKARQCYGAALYPIRWAQVPIAKARGTENLAGWYAIRDIANEVTTDVFGNFIPAKTNGLVVAKDRFFVREGRQWRIEEAKQFAVALDPLRIEVSRATAGIVARIAPTEFVLALPHGNLTLAGPPPVKVLQGRFVRDRWVSEGALPIQRQEGATVLQVDTPKVILLRY